MVNKAMGVLAFIKRRSKKFELLLLCVESTV